VKQGAGPDHFGLLHQCDAAIADCAIKCCDAVEAAIDERLVDEVPKVFGRLQLGTMGGLEDETDAIGDDQVFRDASGRADDVRSQVQSR